LVEPPGWAADGSKPAARAPEDGIRVGAEPREPRLRAGAHVPRSRGLDPRGRPDRDPAGLDRGDVRREGGRDLGLALGGLPALLQVLDVLLERAGAGRDGCDARSRVSRGPVAGRRRASATTSCPACGGGGRRPARTDGAEHRVDGGLGVVQLEHALLAEDLASA
jgi:hypothetical protein